ncbi:hypothetical protein JD844_015057 [Phrynosoma platyrhinos]|uniref:THO complex 5 n=1 Tax=Phrynosoma platyrhinos TaxID=52577 RepID=A0ABQ7T7D7_PHRPL|nr:hypothetical protein JD844_015057 [Phrynosoma platyrhinos]
MSSDSSKKRKPKVIRTDGGPQEGKRGRPDTDQDARYYSEEAEVDLRDPSKDYELYKQTCQDLQRLMSEIQELKSKGSKDSAKQKVDAYHLQLQNLLYEVMHLQKEITKCLEFKSKHEEIELVSVEEFYKEAPPEISKAEITRADPHQQTLSRLDWELEQRKRLANKEKILKEIEVKKEYLSNLQPRLNSIMQASLPVQEYLSMPFEQVHKQYETATHLPPPLYVLFVQASAYGQACDKKLAVAIEGNVEEAKALCKPPEDSQDDESDSDAEEEQNTKRRRPTLGVQLDDKRKEMLKRHPLSVTVDLKCKDGSILHLTFYYLMNLNVMTVKAKVTAATEDLLSLDSLLSCLYPGDHGKRTPNPANQFQFDKVGILSLSDYVMELGHPYVWVQKLGGLHFPKDQPQSPVIADNSLSASHMERTMKLLKTRLESRLALHKQFASLEHGILPVSSECQNLFPAKIVSRLVKWAAVTYEDYLELPYTRDVVEAGLAEDTHLYYVVLIERGTGYQLLTNQLQRLCVVLDVYLETETHDNSVEGPKEFPQEKMGPSRLKPFKYNNPQGFFSHR